MFDLSTITAIRMQLEEDHGDPDCATPPKIFITTGADATEFTRTICYPDDQALANAYAKLRAAWLASPGAEHIQTD